jgi:hypothetical protein
MAAEMTLEQKRAIALANARLRAQKTDAMPKGRGSWLADIAAEVVNPNIAPLATAAGAGFLAGGPMGAAVATGGLLASGNNRPGPFSVAPRQNFGQIDWNASNPFYKSPEQIAQAKADAEAERLRQLAAQQMGGQSYTDWWDRNMIGLGGGDGGAGADGSPGDGGGGTW